MLGTYCTNIGNCSGGFGGAFRGIFGETSTFFPEIFLDKSKNNTVNFRQAEPYKASEGLLKAFTILLSAFEQVFKLPSKGLLAAFMGGFKRPLRV